MNLSGEEAFLVNSDQAEATGEGLEGRRVAVVLFSDYPNDPRPRRAAEALRERGMRVEVICVKQDRDAPARLSLNGVDILRLPLRLGRGGKLTYGLQYLGFLAASFLCLAARCITRRYALVHVHNMPDILVFSALIPKLLGAKVILDLHDPMPELMQTIYGIHEESFGVRLLKFLEKASIGFADVAITVNHTCKKIFSKRSCRPEKIGVIMNSPDEKLFARRPPAPHPRQGRPFAVMYHGSLVERNGLGLAIEAIARLKRDSIDVELLIYGNRTPFLEGILREAAGRGLTDCIHYMGPKKIEEIAEAIDESDLGIIPNSRNLFTEINTPTRIFEFLARGKAVIAPSSPGVVEYFSEDQLLMFKLGDAEDLADRIEFAMKNPGLVLEMTLRGQTVCAAHLWSKERLRFTSLVLELLDNQESKEISYAPPAREKTP